MMNSDDLITMLFALSIGSFGLMGAIMAGAYAYQFITCGCPT
jgi:hypothetical protein